MKPYKGTISDAIQVPVHEFDSMGYSYFGRHPEATAKGKRGRLTSAVMWEQPHHPGQPFEVETRNSRYTIVPR